MEFYARCLQFTPANRPDRFDKARTAGADGLVIDLEDAVAPEDKDSARATAIEYFTHKAKQDDHHFLHCLRINSPRTPQGLKDLLALHEARVQPDALMLPKTESRAEVALLQEVLQPAKIPVIALIETAKGLTGCRDIAADPAVMALVFGGADLAADLGAVMEWQVMQPYRAAIVQACAQAGIAAIDVPYLHLDDPDEAGVLDETRRARDAGFTCKTCIHPKHIQPVLSVFSPSKEEFEQALRIVHAFEEAGGNACRTDGKMIDMPVYRAAKRIVMTGARNRSVAP